MKLEAWRTARGGSLCKVLSHSQVSDPVVMIRVLVAFERCRPQQTEFSHLTDDLDCVQLSEKIASNGELEKYLAKFMYEIGQLFHIQAYGFPQQPKNGSSMRRRRY